jgi:hypothetical protein
MIMKDSMNSSIKQGWLFHDCCGNLIKQRGYGSLLA